MVKSFQINKCVLSFNMEVLEGKKFTYAGRWLSRKGLQESESHFTNLPSTKRLKIKSCTWVGHLNTILVPLRVEFEPTKLQKFKCLEVAQLGRGGGGRLKLQIDRCIMLW